MHSTFAANDKSSGMHVLVSIDIRKLFSSKKRYIFLLLCVVPSVIYSQIDCWPNTQVACFYGDKITKVVFAGINHADVVCNTDPDGKKDFTTSVTPAQVSVGSTYLLSVSVENSLSSGTERLRGWIDYNRNGVFEAAESFLIGTAISPDCALAVGTYFVL